MTDMKIVVSPTDKPRQWFLEQTLYWGNLLVPRGFLFDGASIPIGLRCFFPHGGPKFFAACLHDWLYRNTIGTRKEADGIFLAAMIKNGVPLWKAQLMYSGVRGFGWMSWAKSARKQ